MQQHIVWFFVCLATVHGFTSPFPLTTIKHRPVTLSALRNTQTQRLYAYTAEQQHALEVFERFDTSGTKTIDAQALCDMLNTLDIAATDEDAQALFKYLDSDGDGNIGWEEFLPWYTDASDAAKETALNFQSLLIGRRTVDCFDQTPVDDAVLERAVECAIAAPNRSGSEPWRFIQIGSTTVKKFADLNKKLQKQMETQDEGAISSVDWTQIPGWCVVTMKLSPDNPEKEIVDYKSVCCAVQNLMLSLWSEGIGSKWTSGPVQKTQEFADLCNVDTTQERICGCVWYGFATGGLVNADPKRRKKTVQDVLSKLP